MSQYLKRRIRESWYSIGNPVFDTLMESHYRRIMSYISKTFDQGGDGGFKYSNISREKVPNGRNRVYPRVNDILTPFKRIDVNDVDVVIVYDVAPKNPMSANIPWSYELHEAAQIEKPKVLLDPSVISIETLLQKKNGKKFHRFTDPREDYYPINFDVNDWIKQGVLPMHAVWTSTDYGKTAQTDLWKSFVEKVLVKMGEYHSVTVFVLVGSMAQEYSYALREFAPIEVPEPMVGNSVNQKFIEADMFNAINERLSTTARLPAVNF